MAALLGFIGLPSAPAATLTWTGLAGNGSIGTAGNWSPSQAPVAGDALVFAGAISLAPQLTTSLGVASLVFNSSASAFTLGGVGTYTINSGGITNSSASTQTINNAITLAAAQTWNSTSGALVFGGNINNGGFLLTLAGGSFGTTFNGVISGTGGLTKNSNNTGTITLLGANTYNGTTTLQGTSGTVVIGNNAAFGTGALTLGGSKISTTGGARTIANSVTMTASTTFTNADDLTFNGTVALSGGNRTFTISGTGIVTLNATVSQVSGSRRLTKSGIGTLVLNGTNTHSNGTTLSAGTLVLGTNTAAGTGTLSLGTGTLQGGGGARTFANTVTLSGSTIFNGVNDLTFTGAASASATRSITVSNTNTTFSGIVSGAGGLTKSGAGTLTLSGTSANTLSGTITVNDGALVLNKTAGLNAFAGTALTLGDSAGAASSASVQLNAANQIPDGTSITINADGQLNLQSFTDTITALTMTGGSVAGTSTSRLDLGGNLTVTPTGSNVAVISAGVGLNASRTFTINDNAVGTDSDLTVSGIISTAFDLTKAGTGTLTLSGTNTYSGGTSLNAGTVVIDNSAALGTGAVNLGNTSGSTAASLLFSSTAGRTVSNAITVRSGNTGTQTLGGTNTSGTNTYSGTVTLQKNVTVTAAAGGEVQFGGTIIGTGFGVTKTGAGTVRYNTTNTYTSLTFIAAGTLSYGVSDAIATGPVTIDGTTAVLDLGANHTDSVGQVTLLNGGTIVGTGSSVLTSTVAYDVRSGTVAVPLAGSVALVKTTTGTVTLAAANTYTGVTTINNGTLQLTTTNSLPASTAVSLTSTATLDLGGNNQTIGSLSGAGTVLLGAGILTQGSDNTSTTYSGTLSGTGGIAKAGSGTLTLSGTNTYSGTTTISAGTVKVGSATSLPSATAVTIASGATLDVNGFTTTIGSLAGAGSVTLGSGQLNAGANGTSTTFSGVISGSGNLQKIGAGTLTLTGSSTLTGNVSVNGALTLSGTTGRAVSASGFTIDSGSTLTLDSSTGENADRIGNAAPITLSGGTFRFISDSNGSTETVGALNASGGASNINVVHNGSVIDTTSLTFSSLGTIASGATVNFTATGGTLGSLLFGPRIFITGQANGLIGGWATVGSDFAEYSAQGVRAYTGYYTGTDGINVNDSTKIVLLTSMSPASAYTLTRAGTTTDLGLSLSDVATVDLGTAATRTLNLSGGGLLKSTATPTTISGTGRLTAGGTAAGTLAVSVDVNRTLTLSASIINNAGANGTYGDADDGIVSLSKGSAGLLVLSGANTFSGDVFVNTGTLQIAAENNLGAAANDILFGGGTLSVTSGFTTSAGKVLSVSSDLTGTLDIASGQTLTLANSSGTLATGNTASVLHKTGSGSLIVQGANPAFDGTFSLDAGTLELCHAQALGDATNRGLLMLNGGTLTLRNDTSTAFANDVTLATSSTIDVARLTGTSPTVTHTLGTLSLGAQTLTVTGSNGAALAFGSVALTASATLNPTTADLTVGAVTGSFGFTKIGAGTLTLNGASTYTGTTAINVGTLRLGLASGVPATSAVTAASGTTLDLNNLSASIGSLAGAGSVLLGSGTLSTGGDNTSTTFSGIITGTGGLTKTGSGTFTLSGTNTYSGATTISTGTLRVGSAGGIPSASALSVSVASGATFDLNSFSASIGSLAGSGSVLLGSGTLTTGNDNTATTYAGTISGTGGLTKTGTGIFTLTGANTYTGTTTVSTGTLLVQNAAALGSTAGGTTVASGAELRLASGTSVGAEALTLSGSGISGAGALRVLSGSTSWAGNITLAAATTIAADAGQLTLGGRLSTAGNTLTLTGAGTVQADGILSGGGALIKSGTGTLILTAANTYTGATTISTGTVNAQHSAAFGATGTGPVSIASGAALLLNTAGGISIGDKAFTLSGSGLSGAGVIDSVVGNQSLAGAITLATDVTLAVEADSLTLAGAIGESGGSRALTKLGAGTLVLGGSSTYTGATLINAGTVQLISSERISNASAVTIASGATLDLNDADETIGSLAGAGSISFGTQATASLNTGGDGTSTTFSGIISETGDFIKSGLGTQTLSGANTFTGTVFINGGVLSVNADTRLGDSANGLDFGGGTLRLTSATTSARSINLTTTGTVDTAGVNSTLSAALTGSGSFVKVGTGTLSLTATSTYTGDTLVSTGTLSLSSSASLASASVNVASGATLTLASGATLATTSTILGTGTISATNFTLTSGMTLKPGDTAADSSLGTLSLVPATSGGTQSIQGTVNLGISTATVTDATYGGNVRGSAGYNAWVDSITGVGGHDRLVFGNATSGGSTTLNFLTTSGSLQVTGSGFTPMQGQVFNLLDWGTLVGANFTGFNLGINLRNGGGDTGTAFDLPDISGTGLGYDLSRFTTSGNIVVVATPEPARAWLLLLGAFGLLRRRRH